MQQHNLQMAQREWHNCRSCNGNGTSSDHQMCQNNLQIAQHECNNKQFTKCERNNQKIMQFEENNLQMVQSAFGILQMTLRDLQTVRSHWANLQNCYPSVKSQIKLHNLQITCTNLQIVQNIYILVNQKPQV